MRQRLLSISDLILRIYQMNISTLNRSLLLVAGVLFSTAAPAFASGRHLAQRSCQAGYASCASGCEKARRPTDRAACKTSCEIQRIKCEDEIRDGRDGGGDVDGCMASCESLPDPEEVAACKTGCMRGH